MVWQERIVSINEPKKQILLIKIVLIASANGVFPQVIQPSIDNVQFTFDESIQAITVTAEIEFILKEDR